MSSTPSALPLQSTSTLPPSSPIELSPPAPSNPTRPLSPRADSDSQIPRLRHAVDTEIAGCACGSVEPGKKGEVLGMSAGEAGRAARKWEDAKRGRKSLDGGVGMRVGGLGAHGGGEGREESGFDRFGRPSEESLREAGKCLLVGESGQEIAFEDLIRERGQAVVVFLRHLWCGLCQQYVVALNSATRSLASLSSSSLGSNLAPLPPLYILLISSGSPSLIPTYRSRLNCPFPLYVDPKGRRLYKALGMTRKTLDGGSDEDKGSYVTKGKVANVVASTLSGLSMRGNPGNQSQLGGEFVFASEGEEEGIRCLFSSRMSTTRNHSEVRDLFAAAGVKLSPEDEESVFSSIL